MKKYIMNVKSLFLLLSAATVVSCSDEFLNRPPEDTLTVDNYFSSDAQVAASTNGLYNRTWFNFHNKAFFAIGEIGSGNGFSYSSDVASLKTLTISSTDPELINAWRGLWATVAQSNNIINNLATGVSPAVSQGAIDTAIGEAKFMRGLAYFYIVRLWGPVPIMENNLEYVNTPLIPTNPESDIYEFIERNFESAIELLPEKVRGSNYSSNARVSKGSAKAFLAKVHLYQQEYTEARQLAEEVINSGEFKLYGGPELPGKTFGDLFLTVNNNNEESIAAMQWVASGSYGTASNANTQFAYSPYINMATYGGVFAPSQDLIGAFEPGDIRRKETVMLPGDVYPNITTADGPGLVVPADIDAQGSGAGIKKYVVGKTSDLAGPADSWGMMENNTYFMRYAELLLIHAEAVLAGAGSTSDGAALNSYNMVRERAGLDPVASFTFEDLFHERRVELAFEGDYWYDLGRIPQSMAIAIITAQDRGDATNSVFVTPPSGDFLRLPYPATDLAQNPLLNQDPVPYNFD